MGVIIPKLRQSARGQECTFRIPGICNRDPETTCLCHIRDESKGGGNKANDYSSAFGCSACHEVIDQHLLSNENELWYCLRAMQRTIHFWFENGDLVVPGVLNTRAKPSSKIMPRKPMTVQP